MTEKPQIELLPDEHKKLQIVTLNFTYDQTIIDRLKEQTRARWSRSKKCWYILKDYFDLNTFFQGFKDLAFINYSALNNIQELPKKEETKSKIPKTPITLPQEYMDKLEQKRSAPNTIKIYTSYFADFVRYFHGRDLEQITHEEINSYILLLIRKFGISSSQQNQRINAIKFYYEQVLGREKQYFDIQRPAKERKLPDVLSKEEISKMMNATNNIKHKALIALIYSCGLRRSEAIDLKFNDIDSHRMLIKINGAKGKKDRYVPLATGTLTRLREYYKKEVPAEWVFEGNIKGQQYSATSVYNVVKNTAKKAGIRKRVYPHILRHSFATHHLEQGTDLRIIQELLGHESSETTEIYTHVSKTEIGKLKNPIDDIFN